MYSRRFFLAEGVFAWAKREFGLGRATRRGIANIAVQAKLAFAALNLRKLEAAEAIGAGLRPIRALLRCLRGSLGLHPGILGRLRPLRRAPAPMAAQCLPTAA